MRPATAPSIAPSNGATVYLVVDDFGSLGRACRETDESEANREIVINNMLSGQYENPRRVVAFNTAEGWSRDVSQEIARQVLDRARDKQTMLTESVLHFVEAASWRVDKIPGGYAVRDTNNFAVAYIYWRPMEAEANAAKQMTLDEARRIAVNIAKLPTLLSG